MRRNYKKKPNKLEKWKEKNDWFYYKPSVKKNGKYFEYFSFFLTLDSTPLAHHEKCNINVFGQCGENMFGTLKKKEYMKWSYIMWKPYSFHRWNPTENIH